MQVFKHDKSEETKLGQQEPRIFTDATDSHRLSALIRQICENPRFLLSRCRLL